LSDNMTEEVTEARALQTNSDRDFTEWHYSASFILHRSQVRAVKALEGQVEFGVIPDDKFVALGDFVKSIKMLSTKRTMKGDMHFGIDQNNTPHHELYGNLRSSRSYEIPVQSSYPIREDVPTLAVARSYLV
jgi:hypothetical protein